MIPIDCNFSSDSHWWVCCQSQCSAIADDIMQLSCPIWKGLASFASASVAIANCRVMRSYILLLFHHLEQIEKLERPTRWFIWAVSSPQRSADHLHILWKGVKWRQFNMVTLQKFCPLSSSAVSIVDALSAPLNSLSQIGVEILLLPTFFHPYGNRYSKGRRNKSLV